MQKVFLVQMNSAFGDKIANFSKLESLIKSTSIEPRSFIILPEMFATGYVPQNAETLAEDFENLENPIPQFLHNLAIKNKCFIFGGGIHKTKNGFTNRTVIFSPEGTIICQYDKINLFFPEQKKFSSGNQVISFAINDFYITPFICFDLRFPEIFKNATKKGTNVFIIQAAWGAARNSHWEVLLKARAIENQSYIIAVNAISNNGDFAGNSQVISPNGELIACAGLNNECIVQAIIENKIIEDARKNFPI